MGKQFVKVSIIIPHYRDLASLDLCLAALHRQSFPATDREIIVADNCSPEGEAAVARLVAGRARLTIVDRKGAGPARNGGVALSQGEVLAFTDADCQPEPEWLARGIAALAHCDFAGGGIKVLVADPRKMTPAEAFERVFAFDAESYVRQKGFAATCNLFCPRQVFDAVGPFGVGISEDVEWSHRAGQMGFRIGYAEEAVVGHPARATWGALKKKWIRIDEETYALMMRRPGGRLKWLLLALALPASALVHSSRVIRSDRIQGFRAKLYALAMLYRLRWWRMFDSLLLLVHSRKS